MLLAFLSSSSSNILPVIFFSLPVSICSGSKVPAIFLKSLLNTLYADNYPFLRVPKLKKMKVNPERIRKIFWALM